MQDENYGPPESDVVRPAELGRSELASRWRRLFGAILDIVILYLVIVPVMFSSGYLERFAENSYDASEPFLWDFTLLLIYAVANGFTLHKRGQTLGKMMVATQIVSVNDQQLLPLWKILVTRLLPVLLIKNVPVIGFYLYVINALFIFANGSRCGHDHIAGTIVIDYLAPENLPQRAAV